MSRNGHVFALFLLGPAVVAASGCERPQVELPPARPPVVIVAPAVSDYVTDFEDFTGRTDAIYAVEVRARVQGYLEKVRFKDGDEVKEGDLMFEIDDRPYKADLNRTEASLAQSEAHLKRIDSDLRRVTNLYNRNQATREEFDKTTGDHAEAEAAVGIARANYDLAKLTVGFTKITAQISGRLSRRLIDPGNLIMADTTPLTTIVSLDPLYVYFDVDERTLLRLRRLVHEGKLQTRAQRVLPVMIGLSDEETNHYSITGVIDFSDNRVDSATGTLRVRAKVDNPKPYVLSPGLFVRVRLPIGEPHKSVLVQERAITTDQGQKYVYVVKEKPKAEGPEGKATGKVDDAKKEYVVETRQIKVGRLLDGGLRVVDSDLAAGEMVVVNGLQRIRPGISAVVPRPDAEATKGKPKIASPADPVRVPAEKTVSAPAEPPKA